MSHAPNTQLGRAYPQIQYKDNTVNRHIQRFNTRTTQKIAIVRDSTPGWTGIVTDSVPGLHSRQAYAETQYQHGQAYSQTQ